MTDTLPRPSELWRRPEWERYGIDTLDKGERRTTPFEWFLMFTGTGYTLGSVVFGWLPIGLFGLSFTAAITSMTAGVLVAALIPMTPLMLIATRTATNNSTSSGAHFGVLGRLIGSVLGLALVLLSLLIAIWSAGQVLVAGCARLWHTPAGDGALAVAYILLTVLAAVVAIYGYHLLLKTNAALVVFGVITVGLMPLAFAGHLHPGYAGGHYITGAFFSTWLLSALAVGVGGVMTMGTLVGDSSRYVDGDVHPPRRFLPWAWLAVVLSYVVPMGIGALVTTAFSNPGAPFPQSLVAESPGWYAVILIPMALLGNLGWSGWSIYSTGLDLETIVPRFTRTWAAVVMSVLSVALVLVGSLVWNAGGTLSALSLILLAASAPWAAVIGVGYLRCRGRYSQDDLQAFNRGRRGGIYWYWHGWNVPAVLAWAAGCTFGLLTVQTSGWIYTGPFGATIAGGADVSFAGSFTIAGVLYLVLELAAGRLGRRSQRPVLVGEGASR